MTRSVLFDTETTGLDPKTGDRLIEVACLELVNDLPTGESFHRLVNPEREIPPEATRVHGLTLEDLKDKPLFGDIADDLVAFLGDGPLVAHNAPFDFGFLDEEFKRIGRPTLDPSRMVDTLVMAKTRFPGGLNSLDALCRRFNIDLSERGTHNALLDCRLLAEVYIELTGGRQRGFSLVDEEGGQQALPVISYAVAGRHTPRPIVPSEAEKAAHEAFLEKIKDPLWKAE